MRLIGSWRNGFVLAVVALAGAGCGDDARGVADAMAHEASLTPSTGAIAGTVIDARTGKAARDAMVKFTSQGRLLRSTARSGAADVDSTGRFVFDDLTPGGYTLTFVAPGYRARTADATVVAGVVTTANTSLDPLPATLDGRVFDAASGAPLEGVVVRCNGVSLTTARDGTFTLTGLPPGPLTVALTLGGYRPLTHALALDPGGHAFVELALSRAAIAGGRIVGHVTADDTRAPIPGATITLAQPDGIERGHTVTDALGAYVFQGLEAGAYVVRIDAGRAWTPRHHRVELAEGRKLVVDVALRPAPGRITGVVSTDDTCLPGCAPLGEVHVRAVRSGGPSATAVTASASGDEALREREGCDSTRSKMGRFEMRSLPPGLYAVSFEREDFAPFSRKVRVAPGANATIEVALTPVACGGVTGHVLELDGDAPVADVTVELWLEDGQLADVTKTDADGAYVFDGFEPRAFMINFNHDAWRWPGGTAAHGFAAVRVPAGKQVEQHAEMKPMP